MGSRSALAEALWQNISFDIYRNGDFLGY
jgi:hypothetical protein